jgi:hypothetical protein
MYRSSSRAAVCILRVEVEPQGLIITMTVNRDIATPAAEPTIHFSGTEDAAAAVSEFLESFTHEQS